MSRFFANQRVLIGASTAWRLALVTAPLLGHQPFAFWLTGGLITLNAFHSLHIITRERRILIGLNCVQIVLFGFLNWQLCSAFGPDHYRFDREPWFFDWIEFTTAHVLRAADVLDTIDELGIIIQNISHQSPASGLILIAMHLTVDAFLIGLALRWASQFWQDPPYETRLQKGRREAVWLLATIALFIAFAVSMRMRPLDWLLWPADNLLRLVDVGDILQVSGRKLHGVESNLWTAGGGLVFRLCAGVWMARVMMLWRLTLLRTWGMSIDELTQLLDDPDAQMRRGAAEGLGQSGPQARVAVRPLVEALHDLNASVRRAAAWALGQIGPDARSAAPGLVEAAWLEDRDLRLTAIDALARIGPAAQSAVHDLVCLLKAGDDETRRAVSYALRKIAPSVLAKVMDSLADRYPHSGWADVAKPRRKKRHRDTRQVRRQAAWQHCMNAAETRRRQEHAICARLAALLDAGFFTEERGLDAVCNALSTSAESVERRLLVLPLLRLTFEGRLLRKQSKGGWVYVSLMLVKS